MDFFGRYSQSDVSWFQGGNNFDALDVKWSLLGTEIFRVHPLSTLHQYRSKS